jgi:tetratricopeptide (TPR) repeat protein
MYAVILVAIMVSALVTMSLFTGCASTVETEPELSPERKAAIQDSLKQVWERKLNIAWSLGYENYKNKMYRDAVGHFWKVVEMDTIGKFPIVYNYLGESYVNMNIPDSAEIAYTMGIEEYPEKAYYHRNLGYILAAQGKNEEAIEQYRQAIKLEENPKPNDYRVLGNLLVTENLTEEAIPIYESLLELEPSDVEAQNVYAQILKSTGDEDRAIEQQEISLQQDPENTRLMFTLGETYFRRGEYKNSVEKFQMYLDKNPTDTFAMEYLGNAQQNLGNFRDAISTYEKLLGIDPDNAKILCEMATCYRELEQFSTARRIARRALAVDPNFGLAHIVIGETYEAAVDNCIASREEQQTKFDDKLVNQLAYEEYQKALNDPRYAVSARRHMNYIKDFIPTKEDRFMHPDLEQARFDCYQWIY